MKLVKLIEKISPVGIYGRTDLDITGLSQDSRFIQPGNLFFCIPGAKVDGHQYLHQAAAAGAIAAIVAYIPENAPDITLIQVKEVSKVIKELAGRYYDYPDKKLKLIALTGTNGKTTSTFLMKSILETAGHRVGLIGTITNLIGDREITVNRSDSHNTTPGTLELQQLFAEMVKAGVEYVVMEVSSHSIHQGRIAGLSFWGGIFTNITQDHLDYHKTFEEYLKVKTSFFKDLPVESKAAINIDDEHAEYIIARTKAPVVTYGIHRTADVKAENIILSASGANFTAVTPQGKIDLKLHFTGYFNVYNSLGVLSLALSLGLPLERIKEGLETMTGVPGRFQRVIVPGADFEVIVDFAHTPDGLENILKTGRGLNPHRLLLVFGCGGDRDRTKRPIMGKLAAELADFTIITSDNPRTEDPEKILEDIEAGFKGVRPVPLYKVIADREQAIGEAVRHAQPGDVILIAGKGHETYQLFADRKIHFDDREVAKAVLEERFHA